MEFYDFYAFLTFDWSWTRWFPDLCWWPPAEAPGKINLTQSIAKSSSPCSSMIYTNWSVQQGLARWFLYYFRNQICINCGFVSVLDLRECLVEMNGDRCSGMKSRYGMVIYDSLFSVRQNSKHFRFQVNNRIKGWASPWREMHIKLWLVLLLHTASLSVTVVSGAKDSVSVDIILY